MDHVILLIHGLDIYYCNFDWLANIVTGNDPIKVIVG